MDRERGCSQIGCRCEEYVVSVYKQSHESPAACNAGRSDKTWITTPLCHLLNVFLVEASIRRKLYLVAVIVCSVACTKNQSSNKDMTGLR